MAYILLAEDDKNLATIFRKWLENEGHEVVWVSNGVDGIRNFGDGRTPDLLVTDLLMPKVDGEALTLAFDSLTEGQPVIVVTALPEDFDLQRLGANVREVLHKPVSCDQFLGAVERALKH